MKNQNELALIVAYYLSRFDNNGYLNLGYNSFAEAFREVGTILNVKSRTIQGMRDEFDPYHQNNRVGWVRELKGSRKAVFEAFQHVDDDVLTEIVKEIAINKKFNNSDDFKKIQLLFSRKKVNRQGYESVFINRGKTGRTAELFYMKYFEEHSLPVKGELVDCRELGCGYDFEINDNRQKYYIEVKGMASVDGGILFTNKEWQMAIKQKNNYYLVVIKNVASTPEIFIIQNPALKLKANKNFYTTIQVSWGVSKKNLNLI